MTSTRSSEYIAHFSLWGDFDADGVTNLLGLQPSQVYRKGDMSDDASSPATVSTWDFYCPHGCHSTSEQIDALLQALWPKADALTPLTSRFNAELNVVASSADGSTVLTLDRTMLHKLAALNLSLNCFYLCDEDSNAN